MKKFKKVLCFVLFFILFLSIVSLSLPLEGKTDELSAYRLHPGEYQAWEISSNGDINYLSENKITLPAIALDAIYDAPVWLQSELKKQFYAINKRPIKGGPNASISTGDLNGNGRKDLIVLSEQKWLQFFFNQKIPGAHDLRMEHEIKLAERDETIFSACLLDMSQDGFADIFYVAGNTIFRKKNLSNEESLSFSEPSIIFSSESEGDHWRITGFWWNQQPCLILGKEDGTLLLLRYESNTWILEDDFFPYWEEQWGDTLVGKGVFAEGFAQPAVHLLPNGEAILFLSGKKGDLSTYRMKGCPPLFTSFQLWGKKLGQGLSNIAFLDLNTNGRTDLIYSNSSDPLMYLLNHGTEDQPHWHRMKSDASNNPLNNFFGGSGYHRDGNLLYAKGYHEGLLKKCAQFISNLNPLISHEVIYCIAHFQTEDLISYLRLDLLDILIENATGIHQMAASVKYVEMVLSDEGNTLKYATEDGWKIMPLEIYYPYLVMLNRYLMVPTAYETLYDKNFYRTYLPKDETYGKSLFSRVSDADTLYEAAWKVLYWFKVDIGGVWQMGEKPRGWYNIYHNLLNEDAGIWCGEWSIIFEAAARAMNIPTIIIVALGEDHQFNNFWADGWHHADASSGEAGENQSWQDYIGDSLVYYRNWGARVFSWPMAWEGNGKYDHVRRSHLPYNPPEKLNDYSFLVTDQQNKPLDGARIELWSHWPMEAGYQKLPFISAIGYTDGNGKAVIKQVGSQNFTLQVVSRIGSVHSFLLSKEQVYEDEIHVQVPGSRSNAFSTVQPSLSLIQNERDIRTKTLHFGSFPGEEAIIDPATNRGYIKLDIFAEFVDSSIEFISNDFIRLKKNERFWELDFVNNKVLTRGKEFLFDHPLILKIDNFIYISIRAMGEIFDLKIEWNAQKEALELNYRDTMKVNFSFETIHTEQIHLPWIDGYFTVLGYLEHWEISPVSLKAWIVNETQWEKLQKGKEIDSGKLIKIDPTFENLIEIPYQDVYPFYVIIYNPYLTTSMQFHANLQLQVP